MSNATSSSGVTKRSGRRSDNDSLEVEMEPMGDTSPHYDGTRGTPTSASPRRRALIPGPPVQIMNICMWILVIAVTASIVTGAVVGWKTLGWLISVKDLATPDDGRAANLNTLFVNVISSDAGLGSIKKTLSLLAEQAARLMIFDKHTQNIGHIMLDVSHNREFLWLWQHMSDNSVSMASEAQIVVDFGAYDGMLGSNAYNLIQIGWKGLLVEPHPVTFQEMVSNLHSYMDRVTLVEAGVSDVNEKAMLSVYDDFSRSSSSLISSEKSATAASKTGEIEVKVRKASELLEENKIPKNFGVLSIDTEGTGITIINEVFKAGYRPVYVIWEFPHIDWATTMQIFEDHGYELAGKVEVNVVFFNKESLKGEKKNDD